MSNHKKNPAAVALGRLGAAAGARKAGKARMAMMTPEERSAFGRRAARARWRKAKGRKRPDKRTRDAIRQLKQAVKRIKEEMPV